MTVCVQFNFSRSVSYVFTSLVKSCHVMTSYEMCQMCKYVGFVIFWEYNE